MQFGCFCAAKGCASKKTLLALERARSDIARKRQCWHSWQAKLDPRRLVFIDETWIKTNMAPLRGWGAGFHATRPLADADVPWRLALRPSHRALPVRRSHQRRMLPRLCSAGSRSAASAGRHRHHGQSRSHKSAPLRSLIKAAGARLWYLPPYSPDLNPIEQTFAKIKHWMRSVQKRTIDDVCRHIGGLVTTIQPSECSNYFKNAGYASIKT